MMALVWLFPQSLSARRNCSSASLDTVLPCTLADCVKSALVPGVIRKFITLDGSEYLRARFTGIPLLLVGLYYLRQKYYYAIYRLGHVKLKDFQKLRIGIYERKARG